MLKRLRQQLSSQRDSDIAADPSQRSDPARPGDCDNDCDNDCDYAADEVADEDGDEENTDQEPS
ncbi:MAG: hypothetical protein ACK57P_19435, partial [Planctomycetota bacterium]